MTFQKHEKRVFEIINMYRQNENLDTLQYDDTISDMARRHSFDMANGRFVLGHDGFEERVQKLTKSATTKISENVAYYQGHPINEEIVVQFWLKSKRHSDIIRGAYQTTGIGIAKNDENMFFITQIFVRL